MDIATLLGLAIGISVIALAILTGSDFYVFLNASGFLIVVCGTFAATLIKFPIKRVFVALKTGLKAAFISEKETPKEMVDLAVELAGMVRKGGTLALESAEVKNEFFAKGIQLCVDGYDGEVIEKLLTSEMEQSIARHKEGETIFRGIGESAPAFGMIGTLVGLVQMLSNMEDPKTIGPAMAIALLTTLYGALIANLVAIPIADKLEIKSRNERQMMSLITEGVMQIYAKQNPKILEGILETYLPTIQRHKHDEEAGVGDAQPKVDTEAA
ncbi:MAG: flagellar motor protein PomA [Rhodospirillaceae bacterium]|jgi:chemotaxis protein MotA|nr:flagellar motor protein PomA [Rhodospirillales bacterium]MBT3904197.1 flagellar motor protein PomA [Rhodospirillaceae bacterium]MBT4699981.1 flagellar motor protein PomA [Rhodospirillaceae bacterium]MBT5034103.1 flagellar motor protein PomA [Rhodospirillaceae bacterium]MBT6220995.1 flagellar motor protein PomA [Rhodospirillaceae bacterium]